MPPQKNSSECTLVTCMRLKFEIRHCTASTASGSEMHMTYKNNGARFGEACIQRVLTVNSASFAIRFGSFLVSGTWIALMGPSPALGKTSAS